MIERSSRPLIAERFYTEFHMKDFRDLQVWAKSHQLTLSTYKATVRFPKEELYGLTSQMRRSAASIPANIAEGCGRDGDTELGRFLQIAMASASELEYFILLAHDLGFLAATDHDQLTQQVIETKRMLASFITKLRLDRQKQTTDRNSSALDSKKLTADR